MSAVFYTNPADSSTYVWPKNPASEADAQKVRQIERTANTGNVGATKQQGDDGSYILDWTINVISTAHETALWEWYMLSRLQTIYLTDWNSESVEGQIIQLYRQRVAQPVPGRIDYMVYNHQFEVYRFIAGPLAVAGVTP